MLDRLLALFRPSRTVREAANALIAAHGSGAPGVARDAAMDTVDPEQPDTEAGRLAWEVVGEVERRLGVVRQADTATRWLERR